MNMDHDDQESRHERDEEPHGHSHGSDKTASNIKAGMDNWRRSQLPFGEKLRLSMRNNLIKLRNRSSCCGHPGEPGC
jgi:hypothetical protein